ncbi:hypothetical protein [Variovorax sp. UMC13]|uniref:hypothetical protein n=1 Tax=Variovorax sp. UMC13 TaxID=1862326 RepID=UPI0015FFC4BD|nr:hypothetical protein [Variovorax sp. UMC13]MBB1600472.1 hypothetical protein [Variovorax sp. UMC13]
MIHTVPSKSAILSHSGSPQSLAQAPPESAASLDALFVELLNGYRRSGGLARGSEVAVRAAQRRCDGTSWLENCLERRMVIALDWHSGLWLPLFQFDRRDMSLREEVRGPCAELSGIMDGWELALWFIRPQCLLHHCSPLELLDSQPAVVLDAARREHFLQCA